jgi:hypothetical protein
LKQYNFPNRPARFSTTTHFTLREILTSNQGETKLPPVYRVYDAWSERIPTSPAGASLTRRIQPGGTQQTRHLPLPSACLYNRPSLLAVLPHPPSRSSQPSPLRILPAFLPARDRSHAAKPNSPRRSVRSPPAPEANGRSPDEVLRRRRHGRRARRVRRRRHRGASASAGLRRSGRGATRRGVARRRGLRLPLLLDRPAPVSRWFCRRCERS